MTKYDLETTMPSKEFLACFKALFHEVAELGIPKTGKANFGEYRSIKDIVGFLRVALPKYGFYLTASIENAHDAEIINEKSFVRKKFSIRHLEHNGDNDHITGYARGEGNLNAKNCYGEATANTNALKQFICDIFCLNSTEEMEVKADIQPLLLSIQECSTVEEFQKLVQLFKHSCSRKELSTDQEKELSTALHSAKQRLLVGETHPMSESKKGN